jgi:chromosome partitioning protein
VLKICIAGTQARAGATTTAVTLAHGIALRHMEVVIIDCDPRGQVASLLGLPQTSGLFDWLVAQQPLDEVLRPTETFEYGRPQLSFISSDRKTAGIPYLLHPDRLRTRLKAGLDQLPADYVIFDTSSAPLGLAEIVMSVADLLIIPTRLQPPPFQEVAQSLDTLVAVKSRHWHGQLLGALPTMSDGSAESAGALGQLGRVCEGYVLRAIKSSPRLERCAREGITVWEDDPWSGAADDYTLLVLTVINHVLAFLPEEAGRRTPRSKKPELSKATYELPADLIQRVKKAAWEIAAQYPHKPIWLDDVAAMFLGAGLESYEAGRLIVSLKDEPHAL